MREDEAVDDGLCGKGAYGGADAVGANHEKSLGRRAHRGRGLLVDVETARDVEEVEGHAVDDAREHNHPEARPGVAEAEEPEAAHPRQHRHEHDALDAETFQAEGDEEDAEGLGSLRDGYEGVGVARAPRRGEVGQRGK